MTVMMRRVLVPLVLVLAFPATSQAAFKTFGSDLAKPANVIEAHGADSAFWPVKLSKKRFTRAPAGGQVTEVKVKGTVVPGPPGSPTPTPMIHFQVLHPQPGGSLQVELSSADFYVPIGGNPQQVTTYQPLNLCVHKGDYVDFNDIGGNEWHWGSYDGMPFQTFSSVPDSTTAFYSADNGTNIGSEWRPQQEKAGEELLMQMRLATGRHATDVCPGGFSQHVFQGVAMASSQSTLLRTRVRWAKVRIGCPGNTYGACAGKVRLMWRGRKLGAAGLRILPATTTNVAVPITRSMSRLIRHKRQVRAVAVVSAHDEPAGNSRQAGIAPQSRKRSATVTIAADHP
jgi:hypothetical protein